MTLHKSPAFQFYPKQWLGDNNVMLMDFDVQGMHVHLMSVSWQEDEPATLPNNDEILRKLLRNPSKKDWESRIKPQLFSGWKVWEEDETRIINNGLRREFIKQKDRSDKAKKGAQVRWNKNANASSEHGKKNALLEEEVEGEEGSKVLTKTIEPSWKDKKQGAFEKCWSEYPGTKDGKKKANGHWNASIKKSEDIQDYDLAISRYVEHVQNERKHGFPTLRYKNGSTWFNNWRDWLPEKKPLEEIKKPSQVTKLVELKAQVDPELENLWKNCREKIKEQIPSESYETWFGPTYPRSFEDGTLTIAVPNQFYRKCLIENYRNLIEATLKEIIEKPVLVEFGIESEVAIKDTG